MDRLNESTEHEPLLQPPKTLTCRERLAQCFKHRPTLEPRVVRPALLPGQRLKPTNLVSNTKYNVLTFLPVVLFNQFKFFQNFFFLAMALTQFVPVLKVGLIVTYFAPLLFVLFITMTKEAFEDLQRYYRDRKVLKKITQANSAEYSVLGKKGWQLVQSRLLRVGDIVKIGAGQIVPADLVLLYSEHIEGTIFVKTDQLDGQTDWKLRKSTRLTQKIVNTGDEQELLQISCEASQPSDKIYHFSGLLSEPTGKQEKLSLENCLWASCSVASGQGFGLVVYCGKDTRISMGTEDPHQKIGIFDLEVNRLSKILFLIMMTIATALIACERPHFSQIPNQFIRKLILVSYIFPISVKVNLEISRLLYSRRIGNDAAIQGAVARNSNVCEEMGRIKYLLSDKTGTLTQNDMIFRRMAAGTQNYDVEDLLQADRRKSAKVTQMFKAMALCNSVTIVQNEHQRKYQGASPDEVTLANVALRFAVPILERTQSSISIACETEREDYEILHNFHFTSERKRMGILLKSKRSRNCIFLVKGADSIMEQLIDDQRSNQFLRDYCAQQSSFGLRTLVFASKILTQEAADEWLRSFEQCNMKLKENSQEIEDCIRELENGMSYLGVSCLQDKLQENLRPTLESLRSAGIRIWMVTGDKMETAECISIASGMRSSSSQSILIEDIGTDRQLTNKLQEIHTGQYEVLTMEGKLVTFLTQAPKPLRDRFLLEAAKMKCVICYRCSPAQKGDLVEMLRQHKMKPKSDRVAAIGDGGNDVGMIQNADLGVGLSGKEGKQAALAADFSLQRFDHILKLLLWHGRLSYKRSARLVQYVVYRGMLIGIMHATFIATYSFVSIPLFHGMLQMGYTTIFTFLPTVAIILDEDISVRDRLTQPTVSRRFPELYKTVQQGRELTAISFAGWAFISLFQSVGIFMLATLLFVDHHLEVQTISFTALIVAQYLINLSKMHRLNYLAVLSVLISLGMFVAFLPLFQRKGVASNFTLHKTLWTAAIVGAVWLPIVGFRYLRRKCDPQDYEKVMRREKKKFCEATPVFQERQE